MFTATTAQGMGYANAAAFIALIRKLIAIGTLTEDQAREILKDAIGILEPYRHIAAVDDAVSWIQIDLGSMI